MQTQVMESTVDTTPEAQRLQLINEVIEEVRPNLIRDGGDCKLISVDGNKINVRLTGACVFCKLASATLEGIQAKMIERLGEFVRVIPVPMGFKPGH
jgi:Fe-S cluster biogenesis protein NfuA